MVSIYEIETIKVALQIAEPRNSKTNSLAQAVAILRGIYADLDADQEHFCLLALDNKNHVRGYKVLFSGGMNSSLIDVKVVFRTALLFGATRIIVAHNHPSGDPKPSSDDHTITEEIARAGWFMHIPLNDHIILGGNDYFSFSDQGFLGSAVLDRVRTCYHRFNEEILEEIKSLLPLADPATRRRIRRLLRERAATAADWKRLKLAKSEEMRIKKEALLAKFIGRLREMEDSEVLEALRASIGKDGAQIEGASTAVESARGGQARTEPGGPEPHPRKTRDILVWPI